MAEQFRDSRAEARCADLKVLANRTDEEREELLFLEDYLRDKPKLDIERLKRRGQYFSPGNTATDVAAALEKLRDEKPLLPQAPAKG